MEMRLLTVDEASRYLHLHPQTVYLMVRKGELPVFRVARRAIRFDKDILDQWIAGKIEQAKFK